jgi:predicted NBD/HSP70 family sugar kinase
MHTTIIKHLRTTPLSLAELQTLTQVSLPTLRKAVQDLIDAQWIRVVGQAQTAGGRPAMLYGLDDRLHITVGVHLQLPGMRLIASDLTGAVLDEYVIIHTEAPRPDDAVQSIAEYVAHVRQALPQRNILGIGIATPGFIDPESGDIISIVRVPGWHNFPICARLQALLNIPARIANDVDCMAFAEIQHSNLAFDRNLTYVGFDEGVKISMFLNGELYKGLFGNAGLIQGSLIHVTGASDQHELQQALTIKGVNALVDQQIAALSGSARAPYTRILAEGDLRRRFQLILEAADEGLPACAEVVRLMCAVLASALANIIFIVQPDILILGGVLSTMPTSLYAGLEAAIRSYLPSLLTNSLIIQQAKLSSANRAAMGATHHFLQHVRIPQPERKNSSGQVPKFL